LQKGEGKYGVLKRKGFFRLSPPRCALALASAEFARDRLELVDLNAAKRGIDWGLGRSGRWSSVAPPLHVVRSGGRR
jgi:hypothetical protein